MLETLLPDGKGRLFLVSKSRTLRMRPGEQPQPWADVGSASGAVALGADGSLYLGDGARVRRVGPDRETSVAAEGFGDVYGLAVGKQGALYVSDWTRGEVVRVVAGKQHRLAGGLEYPSGLVLDERGNVFVKESGRQTGKPMRIRRIDAEGKLSLFATLHR